MLPHSRPSAAEHIYQKIQILQADAGINYPISPPGGLAHGLDIKDAYFHVDIHLAQWKFLYFQGHTTTNSRFSLLA